MPLDAWPVRRQTYSYLPSRKASPPIGWYQIILLGDRGTCVLTTCPGLHSIAERPGFELATYWSQVQRPNHSATETHIMSQYPNSEEAHLLERNRATVLTHKILREKICVIAVMFYVIDLTAPFDCVSKNNRVERELNGVESKSSRSCYHRVSLTFVFIFALFS